MLYTLLVTGTSAASLAQMLNLEGFFDRRRTVCRDFSGTYPVGGSTVTMAQTDCDGDVLVAGRVQWTYTVDPATGVATGRKKNGNLIGTANLVEGRVVWSDGNVWGEPFPEVNDEPTNCDMDFTGTYVSRQNGAEVSMVQSGCSGEVLVAGQLHWTFTVDPVTGVATSSRPDLGMGVLLDGTVIWDNGHVWGPLLAGCTGLSQQPLGTVCVGDLSRRHRLGPWHTERGQESCESQCERFLSGRKGCCNQKNNRNLCYAFLGGRTEGVMAKAGDMHWQGIDCNQPEYEGDEFKRSDNALDCPAGFEPIDSLAECQRANDVLNLGPFRMTSIATLGQASRVGGCFFQETGYWRLNGNVMFNNNPAGVNTINNGDRRICRKAAGDACILPSASDAPGRGCPPPAFGQSQSTTCIDNNRPYDTLAEAWAACALFPDCDTITEWGPDMPLGVRDVMVADLDSGTKFRLRRNTDPIPAPNAPCPFANCAGAGYTFTC